MFSTLISVLVASMLASDGSEPVPKVSRLWGAAGECWEGPSRSRLPDFSYAGYRAGEAPLPDRPQVINVTSAPFNAKAGDPSAADANTEAFNRAIAAATEGAVFVPAGTYYVGGIIRFRKSGVVLRGAVDASRTPTSTLHFTRDLADLTPGSADRAFSWAGGLIDLRPATDIARNTTTVTSDRHRGEDTLELQSAAGLAPGMLVTLKLTDPGDGSFLAHVHNDVPFDVPSPQNTMFRSLQWPCRIAEVRGKTIRLTQPLRLDVRASWKPILLHTSTVANSLARTLNEVGIEHLRLRFNPSPYRGHHAERGQNAIYFAHDVVESWIRDVEIENADSGILIYQGCKWITVRDVRFVSARAPLSTEDHSTGHHAILLTRATDILIRGIDFRDVDYIHELSVSHQSNGNVFADIRRTVPADRARALGLRIDMDNHRDWPFENLFTGFQDGVVSSFQTSGSVSYGPQSGARGTYWGIGPTVAFGPSGFAYPPDRPRSSNPTGPRSLDWGKIQTNFVGRFVPEAHVPIHTDPNSPQAFFEPVDELTPRDLHQSQLEYRLSRRKLGERRNDKRLDVSNARAVQD